MTDLSIHTINARGNIFLEVLRDHFGLSPDTMHREINLLFKECLEILENKKINYSGLKSALTPNIDRNEIALVFDTLRIESYWYGKSVFDKILNLFDKNSCHSVLVGDYIGNEKIQHELKEEFMAEIITTKQIDYRHSTQFYLVYINNLSEAMVKRFDAELKPFAPYVGYFNVSNQSFIKDYISTILVNIFLKSGDKIIQGHEDDRDNSENIDMVGYDFDARGYKCRSLQSNFYNLFLSYKIERGIYRGFETDTTFSINALTTNVQDIADFNVVIEEAKYEYLLKAHAGRIKKAGMIDLTPKKLKEFIKEKITSNYIYNMTFLHKHNTIKFNIIIEAEALDTNNPVKLLVALEYIPNSKTLRLITLF